MSVNPDDRDVTTQPTAPAKVVNRRARSKSRSMEEIVLKILKESADKAGAELDGLLMPGRISEAKELAVKQAWLEINEQAIEHAKGIASGRKIQSIQLLSSLGIKLPSVGNGENSKRKARRKKAHEESEQGIAGEGES